MHNNSELFEHTFSKDILKRSKEIYGGSLLMTLELKGDYNRYTTLAYNRSQNILKLYEDKIERYIEYIHKRLNR